MRKIALGPMDIAWGKFYRTKANWILKNKWPKPLKKIIKSKPFKKYLRWSFTNPVGRTIRRGVTGYTTGGVVADVAARSRLKTQAIKAGLIALPAVGVLGYARGKVRGRRQARTNLMRSYEADKLVSKLPSGLNRHDVANLVKGFRSGLMTQ